ncbi:MAG TPA: folylpolyglutamate synthase/dihydrofolate synthase family protein [Gemmatimonadaceae bacterium]|nr:folylpolyglutamate synthase/dihydrofolate synthase family protein [Gemmatimonadaceae bacterium]
MDVHLTSYQATLEYLFARVSGGWKLGLETTRALLDAMGNPQRDFPSFHVAGTNGKGSVVSMLDAVLRDAGLRVGRYMSPHLIDFRERICVDGVPIDESAVTRFAERWMPEVERLGATFFEATTCMAFEHFAREKVDVAVVEVGLGGRLDSTNVLSPLATAVTSIGMDHMQYLGDTIEQIAAEKAGIFKAGVPAVIGDGDSSVRALLAYFARAAGASDVVVIGDDWQIEEIAVSGTGTSFAITERTSGRRREMRTSLVGRHQASNAAVALAMLEVAGGVYAEAGARADRALERVAIPGRFQRCGNIIFDVAHNPAGITVLCEALDAVGAPHPIACLLTVLADKDWRSVISLLAKRVDRFVLTAPPSVPADRAWALDEAVAFAREHGWAAEAEADFDRALELSREHAATTLITGSFHTVGDAMARLQVSPLYG